MPLPYLLPAALLLLASCGGNGPTTTPATPATPAAPAPPPPPPARVFACITEVVKFTNANGRESLRTYIPESRGGGGATAAKTLPAALFTVESLEGGTPTWDSVFFYDGWAATRFGATRDSEVLFRGWDLQPVLRSPGELRVVLRPAGGDASAFAVSVGEEGEPYSLPQAAFTLFASRADENWSMALTDDGEIGNTVFDDAECLPLE